MTVRLRVFVLRPYIYAFDDRGLFQTPDDRLERLTVVSGADGVATLPYFPTTIDPLTVSSDRPGHRPPSPRAP